MYSLKQPSALKSFGVADAIATARENNQPAAFAAIQLKAFEHREGMTDEQANHARIMRSVWREALKKLGG